MNIRLSAFKLLATWQGGIAILAILAYVVLALNKWGQEAAALLPIAGGCVQALGGALRPREAVKGDKE